MVYHTNTQEKDSPDESPVKFTPQQIEDYCEALDSIAKQFPGRDAEKTTAIIRQLREENSECHADMEMEGIGD